MEKNIILKLRNLFTPEITCSTTIRTPDMNEFPTFSPTESSPPRGFSQVVLCLFLLVRILGIPYLPKYDSLWKNRVFFVTYLPVMLFSLVGSAGISDFSSSDGYNQIVSYCMTLLFSTLIFSLLLIIYGSEYLSFRAIGYKFRFSVFRKSFFQHARIPIRHMPKFFQGYLRNIRKSPNPIIRLALSHSEQKTE